MKTIRITVGLFAVVGMLAMAALGAGSASAAEVAPLSEFVVHAKKNKLGEEKFPAKIVGKAVGPQEFKFGRLKVTCEVASVKGTIASPLSTELTLRVAFKECNAGPFRYGPWHGTVEAKFKQKATLVYSYAGWVKSLEEVEVVAKKLKCPFYWEGEWYPEKAEAYPLNLFESATYKTEEVENSDLELYPTGKQQELLLTNNIKGKGLEWEAEEEGVCEESGLEAEPSEGEGGKYSGQLLLEVKKGNIEFKKD